MVHSKSLLSKENATRQNRVWVRIISSCNNQCLFCLDSDAHTGKVVPDEEVRAKIRDGFKPGFVNRIILSGGEASVHPGFIDYIRYAREVGYDRVQTITNGVRYHDRDFCDALVAAGLQEVTFSMHGHTPQLHDYLTGVPGSFQKAVRGILNFKKYHPQVILNIDIVVCRPNVRFLADIMRFYMRMGIREFDLLQIIPFGRGFSENRQELFYDLEKNIAHLHEAWKLSREPDMHVWTNRFPPEVFEGFEDLIQDPHKIASETMGEAYAMYNRFICEGTRPDCWGDRCKACFLKQYCHDFVDKNAPVLHSNKERVILDGVKSFSKTSSYFILRGQEFPREVYEKFGHTVGEFHDYFAHLKLSSEQQLVNVPKCLHSAGGLYETYGDMCHQKSVEEYTQAYSFNLYRRKSTRCAACAHQASCEGIHINFIRAYGFEVLNPIKERLSLL